MDTIQKGKLWKYLRNISSDAKDMLIFQLFENDNKEVLWEMIEEFDKMYTEWKE